MYCEARILYQNKIIPFHLHLVTIGGLLTHQNSTEYGQSLQLFQAIKTKTHVFYFYFGNKGKKIPVQKGTPQLTRTGVFFFLQICQVGGLAIVRKRTWPNLAIGRDIIYNLATCWNLFYKFDEFRIYFFPS